MTSPPPQRFGPHAVVRELGRGAMGIVFEATRIPSGERVALKILLGPAAADAVLRFEREAAALARVDHPGLLRVRAIGTSDTPPWIATELIDGESLRDRLKASPERRLPPEEVRELGIRLSDALAACHRHRLVHRDVKPANILLDRSGRAVLGDFGLARSAGSDGSTDDALGAGTLTATGQVVGTPLTMAPEQFDPETYGRAGPPADVWGLAATLYIALCGRAPFPGQTHLAILTAIQSGPPAAPCELCPEVPRWLSDLLLEALTVDPKRRLAMEPLHERLLAGESRAPRRRRGLPWRVAAVLAPLLVIVGLLLGRPGGLELVPLAWRDSPALITALEAGDDSPALWRVVTKRRAALGSTERARVLAILRQRVRDRQGAAETGPSGDDFARLIRLEAEDPELRDAPERSTAGWLSFRPLTADALTVLESTAFQPRHRRALAALIKDGVTEALPSTDQLRWRARLLELSGQPGMALELLAPALTKPDVETSMLAQAARLAFSYRRDTLAAKLLDRVLKRHEEAAATGPSATEPVELADLVTKRSRLHLRSGERDAAAALVRRWNERRPSPLWSIERSAAQYAQPPWSIPGLPPAGDALLTAMIRRWQDELHFARWITDDATTIRETVLRLRLADPSDVLHPGDECNLTLLLGEASAARELAERLVRQHPKVAILRVHLASQHFVFGERDKARELLATVRDDALPTRDQRRLATVVRSQVTGDPAPLEQLSRAPGANIEDRVATLNLRAQVILEQSDLLLGRARGDAARREQMVASARALVDAMGALLDEEPRLARVIYQRRRLCLVLSRPSEAADDLTRLLEINPRQRDAQLQTALEEARQSSPARGVALLEELVRKHPRYGRAQYFLAQLQSQAGLPARVWLEPARRALRRYPCDETVVNLLLRAIARTTEPADIPTLKRLARAPELEVLTRCRALQVLAHYLPGELSLNPSRGRAPSSVAREVSTILLDLGRPIFDDATAPIEIRQALAGPLVRAAQSLGRTDITTAVLLAAIRLNPAKASHTRSYLLLMKKRGQTREALFELHDPIAESPVVAELTARAALREELFGPALISLDALERQGELSPSLRRQLLRLQIACGSPAPGLEQFEQLMVDTPLDLRLLEDRILGLLSLGRVEEAKRATLAAGLIHGGTIQLDMIRLQLGLEPPERAIRLREMIQIGHPEVLAGMRRQVHALAFQMSRFVEARGLAETLQATAPDDPGLRFLRFFVLAGRDPVTQIVLGEERRDAARAVLADALRRFPDDPGLRWARIFDKRGRAGRLRAPLGPEERRQAAAALAELERSGERGVRVQAIAWGLQRYELLERLIADDDRPGLELARAVRFEKPVRFDLARLLRTASSQPRNVAVRLQAARIAWQGEQRGVRHLRGAGLRFIVRTLELAPQLDPAVRILIEQSAPGADPKLLLRGARSVLQVHPEARALLELRVRAAHVLGRSAEAQASATLLRRLQGPRPGSAQELEPSPDEGR